jgi:hypothetical protein
VTGAEAAPRPVRIRIERRTGRPPGAREWRDEPWSGDGPAPTPQRCEPSAAFNTAFDAIASEQRLECGNRPYCLRRAAVRNWPGFACGDCPRFAAQAPDDLRDEQRLLVALGRVLVDGVEAVEHPRHAPTRRVR